MVHMGFVLSTPLRLGKRIRGRGVTLRVSSHDFVLNVMCFVSFIVTTPVPPSHYNNIEFDLYWYVI